MIEIGEAAACVRGVDDIEYFLDHRKCGRLWPGLKSIFLLGYMCTSWPFDGGPPLDNAGVVLTWNRPIRRSDHSSVALSGYRISN